MSYDNAKACAVVESPSSSILNPTNLNLNNLDLDDDGGLDNLISDSNPKANQYNNHYGEKGIFYIFFFHFKFSFFKVIFFFSNEIYLYISKKPKP
jgi:hypothetical protein